MPSPNMYCVCVCVCVSNFVHTLDSYLSQYNLQVFFTHKSKIEKQSTEEDRDAVRQSLGDNVEPLDQREEDELLDAYK